jgi:hypothetical protein
MEKKCVVCDKTANDVPLIALEYRGTALWICPQDMPALIHKPESLAGRLPGAEDLKPAKDL